MSTSKRICVMLFGFNASAACATFGATLLVSPLFAEPTLTFAFTAIVCYVGQRVLP